MTLYEITKDSTKSLFVMHMAGLLDRGLNREQAIRQHEIDCDITDDESTYYYDYVIELIEE